MSPLELVKLPTLMDLTSGRQEIAIGLLDGPVVGDHPDLQGAAIRAIPGRVPAQCAALGNAACAHGTFVAGILVARRGTKAPAICPNCTVLLHPIFSGAPLANGELPSTTSDQLAAAIVETANAGARVINLSSALSYPSSKSERSIQEALGYALSRDVVIVAAAGNQGTLGSTAITRHPGVIPVVAYDCKGTPLTQSNLGSSIGRRGLGAPGQNVTSLSIQGASVPGGGTSVAAPFVTGAIALLWSEFPDATATDIKLAVARTHGGRRRSIVPPLLDAWGAYLTMKNTLRL